MTVADRLRAFIIDDLGRWPGRPEDLHDDTPLLSAGIIDSLTIFELIGFVESDLGVHIEDDALLAENFETLGAMIRLVESRTGAD